MLVLERVEGQEQPSNLNMHFRFFRVRIYDLRLMLRLTSMADKIGNILGEFEEMDTNDVHRIRRFSRIRAKMHLNEALKIGMVVRFEDKSYRV